LAVSGQFPVAASGLLTMAAFGPATSYLVIAVVLVLFGTGMGLSITPTTASAISAAQRQRSGIASGTVNATRQAGTIVGIAALGGIIASQAVSGLTAINQTLAEPCRTGFPPAAAAVRAPGGHEDQFSGCGRALTLLSSPVRVPVLQSSRGSEGPGPVTVRQPALAARCQCQDR
jgi:MFS family permease